MPRPSDVTSQSNLQMHALGAVRRAWGRVALSVMICLSGVVPQSLVAATAATCAQVKIQIQQKLSLERQAFNATMRIENGLDTPISNISIALKFTDANGNGVVGTTQTNNTDATFFISAPALSEISAIDGSGVIAGRADGQVDWMLIPSAGAGGTSPQGVLYYVGATLTYTIGSDTRTIEVTPDTVTVKPQPQLILDYFLPKEVVSDDPFTPETEAPVPFTLGVRIHNVGGGAAVGTTIESAQPKIIENAQGLAIGFQILDSYVNDQPSTKSLLIPFGDIAPGASSVGRWRMITTLSGQFIEIAATYTHSDALGGATTSLIKETRSHLLLRDVRVDLPGRDAVRDFLAIDGSTLRVYESNGVDTAVTDQTAGAQLQLGSGGKYTFAMPATQGFVYARVVDPSAGQREPVAIVRSDGKVLPTENVWSSRTRNQDMSWSYYLNVFDVDTTGSYALTLAAGSNTGSLAGVVYLDANGNGLRDAGEAGIGVVPVSLTGTDSLGAAVAASGYTDAEGAFVFSQLPAGVYVLGSGTVAGTMDEQAIAGTAGGTPGIGSVSNIVLGVGASGTGYVFGKRQGAESGADVGVTVTASKTQLKLGEDVTFRLTVHNAGPAAATAVSVQDALPAGLTWRSAVTSTGSYDAATGLWTVATLANGADATLDLVARAATPGTLINTVTVTASPSDGNPTNNSASVSLTVADAADLELHLRSSTRQPKTGQTVTLTVAVSNHGPSQAVSVVATNQLPPGLSLASASTSVGTFNSATRNWTIGNLSSGATATLNIVATVLASGDLRTSASVTATTEDPSSGNNAMNLMLRRCQRQHCPDHPSIAPILEVLFE